MAISITNLSGGNTPADGSDPRTFPAIWNATATLLEGVADDLDTAEAAILTKATVVNTDGDPGKTFYVGAVDPDSIYTLAAGDVWIQLESGS